MENTKGSQEAVVERTIGYGIIQVSRHVGLVYILLALNALDVLTTHIGLQMGAVEANPMVAGLMGGVGETATYCIKLSVVLAAAVLLCKLGKPLALKWLNVGMAGVVISNLAVFLYSFAG